MPWHFHAFESSAWTMQSFYYNSMWHTCNIVTDEVSICLMLPPQYLVLLDKSKKRMVDVNSGFGLLKKLEATLNERKCVFSTKYIENFLHFIQHGVRDKCSHIAGAINCLELDSHFLVEILFPFRKISKWLVSYFSCTVYPPDFKKP